ncbi:MAG: 4Fe-4S ferredoxin [Candidatus Eisenbacteria bacterium]|nr:4Fe-4S ferredoxin [Candidatus Eisenbacteria bacterium]
MSHRRDGILDEKNLRAVRPSDERLKQGPVVMVECVERIPCNPCVAACSKGAISIEGDLNDSPAVDHALCDGCGICISACPGLAIFVVDMSREGEDATVMLPYEFRPLPDKGETVTTLDRAGEVIGEAKVLRVLDAKALDRTPIVSLEVPKSQAMDVRHFVRRETP